MLVLCVCELVVICFFVLVKSNLDLVPGSRKNRTSLTTFLSLYFLHFIIASSALTDPSRSYLNTLLCSSLQTCLVAWFGSSLSSSFPSHNQTRVVSTVQYCFSDQDNGYSLSCGPAVIGVQMLSWHCFFFTLQLLYSALLNHNSNKYSITLGHALLASSNI